MSTFSYVFPRVFLFQGIVYFELTSLPPFRHDLDSFALTLHNRPIVTSIRVGVFPTRIKTCLVIFFVSVNAFDN